MYTANTVLDELTVVSCDSCTCYDWSPPKALGIPVTLYLIHTRESDLFWTTVVHFQGLMISGLQVHLYLLHLQNCVLPVFRIMAINLLTSHPGIIDRLGSQKYTSPAFKAWWRLWTNIISFIISVSRNELWPDFKSWIRNPRCVYIFAIFIEKCFYCTLWYAC